MKKFDFTKSVLYTASISFVIITFAYTAVFAFLGESGASFPLKTFMGYIFGKFVCFFLFSLILGFTNRLFLIKKVHKAILRLIHLAATSVNFLLCFIYLYQKLGNPDIEVFSNTKYAIYSFLLFFIIYFLVIAICAIARAIFKPKAESEYKSIINE